MDQTPLERRYGKFIVVVAVLWGFLYAASSAVFEFEIVYRKFVPGPRPVHPILLFIMGATFGISFTCLVAPTKFLQSKTGQDYLQGFGVQHISLFRLKCLLLCVLFATVTGTIFSMVIPDLLENNGF